MELDDVRALLAKAEASTFAEEAEAFSSKAQELMARYAIERAMLEGLVGDGDPVTTEIRIPDPYASAKFALLSAVSQPNRCRALYDRERRVGIVGILAEVLHPRFVEHHTGKPGEVERPSLQMISQTAGRSDHDRWS